MVLMSSAFIREVFIPRSSRIAFMPFGIPSSFTIFCTLPDHIVLRMHGCFPPGRIFMRLAFGASSAYAFMTTTLVKNEHYGVPVRWILELQFSQNLPRFSSIFHLWMPAHWTPSLWPTVATPQRKKHLPGGRITSGDLP